MFINIVFNEQVPQKLGQNHDKIRMCQIDVNEQFEVTNATIHNWYKDIISMTKSTLFLFIF